MKKIVVNKRFAKGKGEYEKVINTIESKGKCPFCQDNFKYHKKPILKKIGAWFITENNWSYKNSKYHFLIINIKHKELFEELTKKDWEGHEKFDSEKEMYDTYSRYYKQKVTKDTPVKVIKFEIISFI